MKKAISILLSVILVFSCVSFSSMPVNAITDYTTGETEDGIFYRIDNETGELTVTWADFNTTDLVIPAYIDGKPVTTIGDNFLCDTPNPNLRSVVIPDTVKNIRFNAFANCINLESVVMSENIEYVEDCVFFNTALTNDESNWDNGSLYIGKLLYGVSTDYSGEFVIKDGTRVIGSNCFCSRYSGKGCEKITNIVIPDSVVSIGVFSFYNCISLTSIDIPDSVKYIDNVAFSQCINLSTININTSNLTYVGQNILRETAYYHNSSNWQDDVLYLNTAALCGKDDIEDLVIKEGTEIIADYAFGCKSGVSSASLPNSLRIICDLAFDDLHALPSIELPDGVEYIGKSAFDGCDLLTELDIPSSVNYIGLFAFNRTDNLEKLIIRNPECTIIDNHEEYAGGAYSVNPNTTVYGYTGSTAEVFANNNGVNFVQLFEESGTTGDCTWTFDNVSGTLNIFSTHSSCELGPYSYSNTPWFSFKDSIKAVVADSGVYSVGANAFTDCTSLETVLMPGVYKIGDYAFYGCESLEKIELETKFSWRARIGKDAFAFCKSLSKICLPFQYITICEEAFYRCSNLETLGMSSSVFRIENNAFSFCPKLSSIYMLDNGTPFSVSSQYDSGIFNTAFSGVKADVYYHTSYISTPLQTNIYGGQFTYVTMTSGIVGYDAYWDYDQQNEKLTISGEGSLFRYYSGNDLPWRDFFGSSYNVTSIIIEDGITEIPSYSFEYMDKVVSVSLPNTLLRLEPIAFRVCESLTEITLPASLEYVDGSTTGYWYRCPNLTDVYYVGTEDRWNEIYDLSNNNNSERITPHFLVYHPPTQSCTQAGYPAHYEFDGTEKDTFYDLNKVAIPTPEPKKLDHSFSKAWTKDENDHWHVCTLCGTEISGKANHLFDNSCDTVCNVCGFTRTIEHNYAAEYTSDDNSHWRVCSVCGDKTDIGLHTWDEGVITTKPTCTETGVKTYTCTVCHKIRTEEIEATGHTIVTDVAVPATCEKTGLTEGSHCSVCHAILKAQEVIPANGHSVVIDKAVVPTCTETGLTEGSHCSVCHAILKAQEVIPANGHSVVIDKAVAPTCTETGLTEGSHCSVCGEVIHAQEVRPANGHTWNNGVVTTPASCHAEGVMTYTCTKCNATKTEPISRLEHVWDDGVITKEPTYTETGELLYTCTLCGDKHTETIPCKEKKGKLTISDSIVRAGDEVQVKLFLDENPGVTALSIDVAFPEYFTLKNVQYTDLFGNQPSNSPFTKNPFTISWASSSTSDVNSTGLFAILTFEVDLSTPVDDYPITISYNANNIFDSSLINVPFDIENGVVTALKPTPGDVNRDGNINMKDLVLIQQFINHWEVNIVESAADVNDDGEINMKDLVLLQRYINGWEVVLL